MSSKSNTHHALSIVTTVVAETWDGVLSGMVSAVCLIMGVVAGLLVTLIYQFESAEFQNAAQQTVTPIQSQSESVSENSKGVPRDTIESEE